MSFYQQLPTFQVETKTGSTMFPSQNEADMLYQKYVKDKTPCEFWRDGEKLKEFKPKSKDFIMDSMKEEARKLLFKYNEDKTF